MKVSELMQTALTVVDGDTTVAEAVVILTDAHVSAVPVIDVHKRLVGVLSTTDILQAEAECASAEDRERLFEGTGVREIMTPRPVVIRPDADVREAAQQMLYLDIHRLFVEDKHELLGVISQSDVVRAVANAKIETKS
ncbi:MAG: CBS domain-containing protein [Gemmatimonadetes bacterium]|nr:CBS domain-containing protein [Gemmatimonadota bacterium]